MGAITRRLEFFIGVLAHEKWYLYNNRKYCYKD